MYKKYWTVDKLDKLYKDWDPKVLDELKDKISKSDWRLGYHIQPETGLLSDPNGFSYFNNQWHLFYQAFPYGAVHGLKSWSHVVSDDLVHWENVHKPMVPDQYNDIKGCFSGSAYSTKDKLFLMYTGNVFKKNKYDESVRYAYQNGAWMDKNNNIKKLDKALIDGSPDGITGHFRDPQVIKHGKYYYAFLGARSVNDKGQFIVYRSTSLDNGWTYYKHLDVGAYNDERLGYMAECPNIGFIDGKLILVFCPQGADHSKFRYSNFYPTAYIIADALDWDNMKLINPSKMQQLDEGFDFYATQLLQDPNGRLLEVAWIGVPDTDYLSPGEGWVGSLSMIRELSVKDNKLFQKPVDENNQLISSEIPVNDGMNICKQSVIKFNCNSDGLCKIFLKSDNSYLKVYLDNDRSCVKIIRKNWGEQETSRECPLDINNFDTCYLYLDNTVFELFINNGMKTMTGNFYHDGLNINLHFNNLSSIKINKMISINN
ncbi:sucrose-6-phosphate hydrolase [Apilactobacillus apisilvae]|uniref:Sucrose-6-phosphate hydrolase n=1 Tax=Apilactobacillus apisilvae TaxID=2923364 RepID=A0ABY4PHD3_9LACO|nr:sucrose-6-phosphate hydrolase [Apilactobacillus apisilvae]UQS84871.1 sucrose-6-phosphate hydrolase [Apilactobacillus apisilvae]